jgi:hypothetical protein
MVGDTFKEGIAGIDGQVGGVPLPVDADQWRAGGMSDLGHDNVGRAAARGKVGLGEELDGTYHKLAYMEGGGGGSGGGNSVGFATGVGAPVVVTGSGAAVGEREREHDRLVAVLEEEGEQTAGVQSFTKDGHTLTAQERREQAQQQQQWAREEAGGNWQWATEELPMSTIQQRWGQPVHRSDRITASVKSLYPSMVMEAEKGPRPQGRDIGGGGAKGKGAAGEDAEKSLLRSQLLGQSLRRPRNALWSAPLARLTCMQSRVRGWAEQRERSTAAVRKSSLLELQQAEAADQAAAAAAGGQGRLKTHRRMSQQERYEYKLKHAKAAAAHELARAMWRQVVGNAASTVAGGGTDPDRTGGRSAAASVGVSFHEWCGRFHHLRPLPPLSFGEVGEFSSVCERVYPAVETVTNTERLPMHPVVNAGVDGGDDEGVQAALANEQWHNSTTTAATPKFTEGGGKGSEKALTMQSPFASFSLPFSSSSAFWPLQCHYVLVTPLQFQCQLPSPPNPPPPRFRPPPPPVCLTPMQAVVDEAESKEGPGWERYQQERQEMYKQKAQTDRVQKQAAAASRRASGETSAAAEEAREEEEEADDMAKKQAVARRESTTGLNFWAHSTLASHYAGKWKGRKPGEGGGGGSSSSSESEEEEEEADWRADQALRDGSARPLAKKTTNKAKKDDPSLALGGKGRMATGGISTEEIASQEHDATMAAANTAGTVLILCTDTVY